MARRKSGLPMMLAALLAAAPALAQPQFQLERIPTPAQADAVPLYPAGTLPAGPLPERWGRLQAQIGDQHMDARIARNISVPTITPVLPAPGKATGAAVVIAPGGAFLSLSMDSEGFDIAHRLADEGIAAFVLKYRTNPVPDEEPAFMGVVGQTMGAAMRPGGSVAGLTDPYAAQDALQALRLVRQRAAQWHVDAARVGMIGFSAGAMTALQAVTTGTPADRPAFFGFIYGPMVAIPVPADAPPMFAALAIDDPLFGRDSFGIVDAWRKAGRPVELHAYQQGDHGFGAGRPGTTTTLVLPEFVAWLKMNHLS